MERLEAAAVRELGVLGEKFPCIVCLSEKNSIQELHDHQKNLHTTEELSFSIIRFVHYICLKDQVLALDLASNCHSTNCHFCQSHNQTHIISSKNCAINNPSTPYASSETNHKILSFFGLTKAHEKKNQALRSPLISKEDLGKSDQLVLSSLEIELSKVPEISDKTFLKCVDEICRDLEVIGRAVFSAKRQGAIKSAIQTNRGAKRNAKRLTGSQNRLILALTKMKRTGDLQRSQTYTEFPIGYQSMENIHCRYQETTAIDNGSTKIEPSTSKETAYGSNFGQTLSVEGIPTLEKVSKDLNKYEQELMDMPVLESQVG